jgi:hypothetical protein
MTTTKLLRRIGLRRRPSIFNRVATEIGKGIVSGLAGTLAITISQMIEMRLSGRKPSTAPADAAGKVLGVQPRDQAGKTRFANVIHWAYGTAWGLARAALGGTRRGRLWAPLAHLAAVQTTAMLVLPGLDVAPPATKWGAKAISKEVLHHTVYATAADATYRALS